MAIGELADENMREASRIHRDSILSAEAVRLTGSPTYTVEEVRAMLSGKFCLIGQASCPEYHVIFGTVWVSGNVSVDFSAVEWYTTQKRKVAR